MFLAGASSPVSYVQRGDRRIMLVRPGPAIEPHLLEIESILPVQVASSLPRTGVRALLLRLLVEALGDAGLLAGGRCAPARARLGGELDAQVALPVRLVCDALGLDPSVLAAAVARARSSPSSSGRP